MAHSQNLHGKVLFALPIIYFIDANPCLALFLAATVAFVAVVAGVPVIFTKFALIIVKFACVAKSCMLKAIRVDTS